MGTLTGTQLESEIKANLGNRDDLDTRLYIFLNWAQTDIARQIYLRELEGIDTSLVTVADQDYVAEGSNMRDLISFRLIDGTQSRKLKWIPRREYDELMPYPSSYSTGRCTHFTSWAEKLYLYPIPDAVYSMYAVYTQWPTAFTDSDSSASDIDNLDELIVILATIKAMRSLKDTDPKDLSSYKRDAAMIMKDAKEYDKHLRVDEEVSGMRSTRLSYGEPWLDPFVRR